MNSIENWLVNTIKMKLSEKKNAYNQFMVLQVDSLLDYKEISEMLDIAILDVNIRLSGELLSIPPKLRPLKTQQIVSRIIKGIDNDVILIDNFELLFEPSLKTKPIDLFRELSRYKVIILIWRYQIKEGKLAYATPSHPEYQKGNIKEYELIAVKEN